ncbi:MAG TPA: hypothetical protein PKZ69_00055 [Candidatus Cloacimonadota bacterium]|nr:hypothetical protein [Candidatus Cloacimonadota bacterium]HPK39984.1 hypothetical protein [Candidatus Cloacimonadota bacterium]
MYLNILKLLAASGIHTHKAIIIGHKGEGYTVNNCIVCNSAEFTSTEDYIVCNLCGTMFTKNRCKNDPQHISFIHGKYCDQCGTMLKNNEDFFIYKSSLDRFNSSSFIHHKLEQPINEQPYTVNCADEGLFIDKKGRYIVFKRVYIEKPIYFEGQLNINGSIDFASCVGMHFIFKVDKEVFKLSWKFLWEEKIDLKPAYLNVSIIKQYNQKIYLNIRERIIIISHNNADKNLNLKKSIDDLFVCQNKLYSIKQKADFLTVLLEIDDLFDYSFDVPISKKSFKKLIAVDDYVLFVAEDNMISWVKVKPDELDVKIKKLTIPDNFDNIDAFYTNSKIYLLTGSSIYEIDTRRFNSLKKDKDDVFTRSNIVFDRINNFFIYVAQDMHTHKYNIVFLDDYLEQVYKIGNFDKLFTYNITDNNLFAFYNSNEGSIFCYLKKQGENL